MWITKCPFCGVELLSAPEWSIHKWRVHYAESLLELVQRSVEDVTSEVKHIWDNSEVERILDLWRNDPTITESVRSSLKYRLDRFPSRRDDREALEQRENHARATLARIQVLLSELEAQAAVVQE